jgi:hypothetical protein
MLLNFGGRALVISPRRRQGTKATKTAVAGWQVDNRCNQIVGLAYWRACGRASTERRTFAARQHPVLDIGYWERQFPLTDKDGDMGEWIDDPSGLARREQAIRQAKTKGSLGPSVPAEVFVWADTDLPDLPWPTRIGGTPWRPKGKIGDAGCIWIYRDKRGVFKLGHACG